MTKEEIQAELDVLRRSGKNFRELKRAEKKLREQNMTDEERQQKANEKAYRKAWKEKAHKLTLIEVMNELESGIEWRRALRRVLTDYIRANWSKPDKITYCPKRYSFLSELSDEKLIEVVRLAEKGK